MKKGDVSLVVQLNTRIRCITTDFDQLREWRLACKDEKQFTILPVVGYCYLLASHAIEDDRHLIILKNNDAEGTWLLNGSFSKQPKFPADWFAVSYSL